MNIECYISTAIESQKSNVRPEAGFRPEFRTYGGISFPYSQYSIWPVARQLKRVRRGGLKDPSDDPMLIFGNVVDGWQLVGRFTSMRRSQRTPQPRSQLVDESVSPWYHCVSGAVARLLEHIFGGGRGENPMGSSRARQIIRTPAWRIRSAGEGDRDDPAEPSA